MPRKKQIKCLEEQLASTPKLDTFLAPYQSTANKCKLIKPKETPDSEDVIETKDEFESDECGAEQNSEKEVKEISLKISLISDDPAE